MDKPKPSEFLTFDQIAEFSKDKVYRDDTPAGETPVCYYCGKKTQMRAYTDMGTGTSWPACCADCTDKWDPLPKK